MECKKNVVKCKLCKIKLRQELSAREASAKHRQPRNAPIPIFFAPLFFLTSCFFWKIIVLRTFSSRWFYGVRSLHVWASFGDSFFFA